MRYDGSGGLVVLSLLSRLWPCSACLALVCCTACSSAWFCHCCCCCAAVHGRTRRSSVACRAPNTLLTSCDTRRTSVTQRYLSSAAKARCSTSTLSTYVTASSHY